jgi:hypothetical protein
MRGAGHGSETQPGPDQWGRRSIELRDLPGGSGDVVVGDDQLLFVGEREDARSRFEGCQPAKRRRVRRVGT